MTLEQPPFPKISHAEATGGSSCSTEVERTPHDQRSFRVRILRGVGLFKTLIMEYVYFKVVLNVL